MKITSSDSQLQKILVGDFQFHRRETETDHALDPTESILPRTVVESLNSDELTCHGIGTDVLRFIAETVDEHCHTMETGAGKSTLVFALSGARHITITPAQSEIEAIKEYATLHDISMESLTFIAEPSESYLPRCGAEGLDLVLIDGKHAFPWPMIDWFFMADKLRQGGIMLVDDLPMKSVSVLVDFLCVDSGWRFVRDFSGKTVAFQKLRASAHDVAWHMQPFNKARDAQNAGLFRRIRGRIGREIRKFTRP